MRQTRTNGDRGLFEPLLFFGGSIIRAERQMQDLNGAELRRRFVAGQEQSIIQQAYTLPQVQGSQALYYGSAMSAHQPNLVSGSISKAEYKL